MKPTLAVTSSCPGSTCVAIITSRHAIGRRKLQLTGLCRPAVIGIKRCLTGEHHPGDARELVGDRAGGDVSSLALQKRPRPAREGILASSGPDEITPCPMDQERSHIHVAALGDAKEPLFAAGGMLAGRQAQARRQMPAASVRTSVSRSARQLLVIPDKRASSRPSSCTRPATA